MELLIVDEYLKIMINVIIYGKFINYNLLITVPKLINYFSLALLLIPYFTMKQ